MFGTGYGSFFWCWRIKGEERKWEVIFFKGGKKLKKVLSYFLFFPIYYL